ncbi:MAG: hypothetical protein ABIR96_11785 [Bdellovibrionota bacterium]
MKALSKNLVFALATLVAVSSARAHVPNPSQLARFQPGLLNRSRSFESTGSVQTQGKSMGYVLSWVSPEVYSVRITKIPASIYAQGRGPENWTLVRKQTLCIIKTDSRVVNCPSPQAWALLELSGVPEAGARGLYTAEILDSHEIAYRETDSTIPEDISQRRVMLVMSHEGKTPAAHLEIRGKDTNTSTPGLEFPLVRFDQTFLAPVLLRIKNKGEIFTVSATSDLEIRRGRNRFTPVLSEQLLVQSNLQQSVLFRREEPKPTSDVKLPVIEKSLTQIDAFRDELSVGGQFLLDALLVTH